MAFKVDEDENSSAANEEKKNGNRCGAIELSKTEQSNQKGSSDSSFVDNPLKNL